MVRIPLSIFICLCRPVTVWILETNWNQTKEDDMRITETIKLSVDETPMQITFWDIRGVDYDPSWLHNAHVALVCFSVNIGSTDAKGKHLGRVRFPPSSLQPLPSPLPVSQNPHHPLTTPHSGSPK